MRFMKKNCPSVYQLFFKRRDHHQSPPMDRFNTYKKYITLLHAVPLRGVADGDGKRLVAEGVGEREGWTGRWLERMGDGGMLEGGWREDEGWRDFRECLERVRDGGMLGCREVAGESG